MNQEGQLNKVGSHTIKYFIVISANNLILVQFTFYYKRFDLLSVENCGYSLVLYDAIVSGG
jgi:hypothetical protein